MGHRARPPGLRLTFGITGHSGYGTEPAHRATRPTLALLEPPLLLLPILAFTMLVGWLGQLALGMGTRPNGQSLIAGFVGAFVGGLLFSLIAHEGFRIRPSGLIGSFVGAIIVLAIWGLVDKNRK